MLVPKPHLYYGHLAIAPFEECAAAIDRLGLLFDAEVLQRNPDQLLQLSDVPAAERHRLQSKIQLLRQYPELCWQMIEEKKSFELERYAALSYFLHFLFLDFDVQHEGEDMFGAQALLSMAKDYPKTRFQISIVACFRLFHIYLGKTSAKKWLSELMKHAQFPYTEEVLIALALSGTLDKELLRIALKIYSENGKQMSDKTLGFLKNHQSLLPNNGSI